MYNLTPDQHKNPTTEQVAIATKFDATAMAGESALAASRGEGLAENPFTEETQPEQFRWWGRTYARRCAEFGVEL